MLPYSALQYSSEVTGNIVYRKWAMLNSFCYRVSLLTLKGQNGHNVPRNVSVDGQTGHMSDCFMILLNFYMCKRTVPCVSEML
jgi:hypothetical protein